MGGARVRGVKEALQSGFFFFPCIKFGGAAKTDKHHSRRFSRRKTEAARKRKTVQRNSGGHSREEPPPPPMLLKVLPRSLVLAEACIYTAEVHCYQDGKSQTKKEKHGQLSGELSCVATAFD